MKKLEVVEEEKKVEKEDLNVKEELSMEEWSKMEEGLSSKVDYEKVWEKVKGKIMSNKGLEKVVNKIRGFEREFYWSEKDRVFKSWRKKGRKIEEKLGIVGNRRRKFYRFLE